ncbi:hypothetical protein EPN52_09855 [bacterium]|nr:MAG: hypothetical protein EPN52_09855 [bacterium]
MKRTAAGALGGLLAGTVLAVAAMTYSMLSGKSFIAPALWLAGLIFEQASGNELALGSAAALHLTISAGLGMLFVHVHDLLVPSTSGALAGVVYGALIYVIDRLVLEPALSVTAPLPLAAGLFVHLLYGGMLGALTSSSEAESSR